MTKLVPFTQEELNLLKGLDRVRALEIHHEWLKKQRETDRGYSKKLSRKVKYFKNREKMAKWRKDNKLATRKYNQRYNLKKKYIQFYGNTPETMKKIKDFYCVKLK